MYFKRLKYCQHFETYGVWNSKYEFWHIFYWKWPKSVPVGRPRSRSSWCSWAPYRISRVRITANPVWICSYWLHFPSTTSVFLFCFLKTAHPPKTVVKFLKFIQVDTFLITCLHLLIKLCTHYRLGKLGCIFSVKCDTMTELCNQHCNSNSVKHRCCGCQRAVIYQVRSD